jgi:hypothetical protein
MGKGKQQIMAPETFLLPLRRKKIKLYSNHVALFVINFLENLNLEGGQIYQSAVFFF